MYKEKSKFTQDYGLDIFQARKGTIRTNRYRQLFRGYMKGTMSPESLPSTIQQKYEGNN